MKKRGGGGGGGKLSGGGLISVAEKKWKQVWSTTKKSPSSILVDKLFSKATLCLIK